MFSQSMAAQLRHHPALASLTISLGLNPDEVTEAVPSIGSAVLGGLVDAVDSHGSITPLADALLITPYETVSEALANLNQLQSSGNDLLDGLFREKRGRAVIAIAQESGVPTSAVGRLFPFVAPAVIAGLRAHVRRTGVSAEGLLSWIRADIGTAAPGRLVPTAETPPAPEAVPESVPNAEPEFESADVLPDRRETVVTEPRLESLASVAPVGEAGRVQDPTRAASAEAPAFDSPAFQPPTFETPAPASTLGEALSTAPSALDGSLNLDFDFTAGPEPATDRRGDVSTAATDWATHSSPGVPAEDVAGVTAEDVAGVPAEDVAGVPAEDELDAPIDVAPSWPSAEPEQAPPEEPVSLADILAGLTEPVPVADVANPVATPVDPPVPSALGSSLVPVPTDPMDFDDPVSPEDMVDHLRGFPLSDDDGPDLEPIGTLALAPAESEIDPVAEEYRDIDHLRAHGEKEVADTQPQFSNLAWVWWAVGAVAVLLMMVMVLSFAGSS